VHGLTLKLFFAMCLVASCSRTTAAQRVEARFGVLFSSALASDDGAEPLTISQYAANYEGPVTLRLSAAPLASVAVVKDVSARSSLEASALLAIAKLRGHANDTSWPVQDVSLAALTLGIRHQTWSWLSLNGGLGLSRFFTESNGIFRDGSSTMPMLEVGATARFSAGQLPLQAGVRVQTHTFGTPTLRSAGAEDGRVNRFLLQVGIGG
jgi:hypothetical protein